MKTHPPYDQLAFRMVKRNPENPVLVFLHDSLGCMDLWRDFPDKLSELTQCGMLVYDRQGYGKSCDFIYSKRDNDYMELEADILAGLLDYHDIDRVILFGHSDGGSIAIMAASKYPHKIQAIITEGAHVLVENITLKGIADAEVLYRSTDLSAKLAKYHGSKTENMFYAWVNTWLSTPFRTWNMEHFLPGVTCPSLIIQGELDEYGTQDQVRRIVDQVGGTVTQLILPQVGHTPHKESPETVLAESAAFIHKILHP